jgi:hypothetical protein
MPLAVGNGARISLRDGLGRSFCATGRAIFAVGILLHCNIPNGGGDADLAFDTRKERS